MVKKVLFWFSTLKIMQIGSSTSDLQCKSGVALRIYNVFQLGLSGESTEFETKSILPNQQVFGGKALADSIFCGGNSPFFWLYKKLLLPLCLKTRHDTIEQEYKPSTNYR
ncbi:MAG: hypothetical protein IJU62_04790 [Muribaculaceae bacterium]|nr:hypothetical protein [Muribaculaceae bacterium]